MEGSVYNLGYMEIILRLIILKLLVLLLYTGLSRLGLIIYQRKTYINN